MFRPGEVAGDFHTQVFNFLAGDDLMASYTQVEVKWSSGSSDRKKLSFGMVWL